MNATDWLHTFEKDNKTIREISRNANVTELEVLRTLITSDQVALYGKDEILPLLNELSEMGTTLVIVENQGSIFEIKCRFPKGLEGYGYYNLKIEGEYGLGGHVDINHINHVAVTSEIFFNKPSKAWWFIHESGRVVFKVYVGRDENGEFKPNQLTLFEKWLQKQNEM